MYLAACRRPKRQAAGASITENVHQALLRQRMAVPLPQEAAPPRKDAGDQAAASFGGPSAGLAQLAGSLARLQQLEDSELRGPSPSTRQLLQQSQPSNAAVGSSHTAGSGGTLGIHESPALPALHGSRKAERGPASNAEQTLPRALRKHVTELSTGGNSSSAGHSNPPTPPDDRGDHEERETLESMQSTLAAGLPKLGPALTAPA